MCPLLYTNTNYHHNKYRHWGRIIKTIDETKINGYAFIVECCGDDLKLYKVKGNDDKEIILEGRYNKFVSFIQEAQELINL